MLRITTNVSSAVAKTYFSTADYYSEGQELEGRWRGKAAMKLGLSGAIHQEDWDSLCDNRDPRSGNTLTVRRKSERRVGYDFTFDVCKSVSMLYGITRDQRVFDVVQKAAYETMCELETLMETRVRKAGRNEDRTTGNLCWGEHVHLTSRPVDGVPDPQLHVHCFAFNLTWDAVEERWKAGQFAELKAMAPYYEAAFQSKVASGMMELGLTVERSKTGWELAGLDKATLDKFSRRTALIEKLAKEKGITDPVEKSELGAKTREKKQKQLSMSELQEEWKSRLSDGEQDALKRVIARVGTAPIQESPDAAREAVDHAIGHCFERDSVVVEKTQLLREALRRSYGQASRKSVETEAARRSLIRGERNGKTLVTSIDVLAEESAMIAYARDGRGTMPPLLAGSHEFARPWLNDGQKQAVRHVLASFDKVILVTGKAGTGKTTMMQEAVEAIQSGGHRVFTFAPSAGASRGVLREAGFADAETVSRLLVDEKLQEQLRNQVAWIDETSLLSVRTMKQVFDLADKLDCRLILGGDRHQHGSVERGSALRLLEEEAGLRSAEVTEIKRQEPADYRNAVKALSEGRVTDAFRRLDQMGCIREIDRSTRYKALAAEYLDSIRQYPRVLVVAPTHLEGEWVTQELRTSLRNVGAVGKEERLFSVLEPANLTVAERGDKVNYAQGDVVQFNQNAPGIRRGTRLVVGDQPIPLQYSKRFNTFHQSFLPLSAGDRIRVTHNGTTQDGQHRLNNGDLFTIDRFNTTGDLVLNNGWVIDKDFGHIAHGYALTSHAAQGKSVDKVIVAQSSTSFAASSLEQFYVSVSRAKYSLAIFTDSRLDLMEAISKSDDRMTATEFVGRGGEDQRVAIAQLQRQLHHELSTPAPQRSREDFIHER